MSKLRASSGALLTRACGWGGGDSELRHPWGGALAGQRLFVMDAGNSRVCCFSTSNLTFKYAFGAPGRRCGWRGRSGEATHAGSCPSSEGRVRRGGAPGGVSAAGCKRRINGSSLAVCPVALAAALLLFRASPASPQRHQPLPAPSPQANAASALPTSTRLWRRKG